MSEFLITLWLLGAFAPVAFVTMCCCEVVECVFFEDDFSTDRLSTDYTISSGSWAVSGGVLSTTSASALITSDTAVPGGQTTLYAEVTATCAGTSDIAKLVGVFSDTSNYWWAEVQPGATDGSLRLFQRTAGVNTQRGSTVTITGFSAGDTAIIYLCVYSDLVVASATHAGGTFRVRFSPTTPPTLTSTKGGLGTGAASSSVTFNNFQLAKHDFELDGCPTCPQEPICDLCDEPLEADYIVDIGTATLTNEDCDACDTVQGEYLVSEDLECRWVYRQILCTSASPGPFPCTVQLGVVLRLVVVSAGNVKWTLDIIIGCGSPTTPCGGSHPGCMMASYESDTFSTADCDSLPRTLSKISENHLVTTFCDGLFPDDVQVLAA